MQSDRTKPLWSSWHSHDPQNINSKLLVFFISIPFLLYFFILHTISSTRHVYPKQLPLWHYGRCHVITKKISPIQTTTSHILSPHVFLLPVGKLLLAHQRMAIQNPQRNHPPSLDVHAIAFPLISDRRPFTSRIDFSTFRRHPRTTFRNPATIPLCPIRFRTNRHSTTNITRHCHNIRIRKYTISCMPFPP